MESIWSKTHVATRSTGLNTTPLLQNFYASDILNYITTKLAKNAGDIRNYDKNHNARFAHLALQHRLKQIGLLETQWRININADKTRDVVFWRTRLKFPELRLHNTL
jgi:hypothetical protein